MHNVYLLESETFGGQRYIGLKTDLRQRLADHNAGKSPHTSKYNSLATDYVCGLFRDREGASLRTLFEVKVRATPSRKSDSGEPMRRRTAGLSHHLPDHRHHLAPIKLDAAHQLLMRQRSGRILQLEARNAKQ